MVRVRRYTDPAQPEYGHETARVGTLVSPPPRAIPMSSSLNRNEMTNLSFEMQQEERAGETSTPRTLPHARLVVHAHVIQSSLAPQMSLDRARKQLDPPGVTCHAVLVDPTSPGLDAGEKIPFAEAMYVSSPPELNAARKLPQHQKENTGIDSNLNSNHQTNIQDSPQGRVLGRQISSPGAQLQNSNEQASDLRLPHDVKPAAHDTETPFNRLKQHKSNKNHGVSKHHEESKHHGVSKHHHASKNHGISNPDASSDIPQHRGQPKAPPKLIHTELKNYVSDITLEGFEESNDPMAGQALQDDTLSGSLRQMEGLVDPNVGEASANGSMSSGSRAQVKERAQMNASLDETANDETELSHAIEAQPKREIQEPDLVPPIEFQRRLDDDVEGIELPALTRNHDIVLSPSAQIPSNEPDDQLLANSNLHRFETTLPDASDELFLNSVAPKTGSGRKGGPPRFIRNNPRAFVSDLTLEGFILPLSDNDNLEDIQRSNSFHRNILDPDRLYPQMIPEDLDPDDEASPGPTICQDDFDCPMPPTNRISRPGPEILELETPPMRNFSREMRNDVIEEAIELLQSREEFHSGQSNSQILFTHENNPSAQAHQSRDGPGENSRPNLTRNGEVTSEQPVESPVRYNSVDHAHNTLKSQENMKVDFETQMEFPLGFKSVDQTNDSPRSQGKLHRDLGMPLEFPLSFNDDSVIHSKDAHKAKGNLKPDLDTPMEFPLGFNNDSVIHSMDAHKAKGNLKPDLDTPMEFPLGFNNDSVIHSMDAQRAKGNLKADLDTPMEFPLGFNNESLASNTASQANATEEIPMEFPLGFNESGNASATYEYNVRNNNEDVPVEYELDVDINRQAVSRLERLDAENHVREVRFPRRGLPSAGIDHQNNVGRLVGPPRFIRGDDDTVVSEISFDGFSRASIRPAMESEEFNFLATRRPPSNVQRNDLDQVLSDMFPDVAEHVSRPVLSSRPSATGPRRPATNAPFNPHQSQSSASSMSTGTMDFPEYTVGVPPNADIPRSPSINGQPFRRNNSRVDGIDDRRQSLISRRFGMPEVTPINDQPPPTRASSLPIESDVENANLAESSNGSSDSVPSVDVDPALITQVKEVVPLATEVRCRQLLRQYSIGSVIVILMSEMAVD